MKKKNTYKVTAKSKQEKILEKIAKIALFEKDPAVGLEKIQKILQNNS